MQWVAPRLRSYVQSPDFLKLLEEKYKKVAAEKVDESFFLKVGIFFGETFNVVNFHDAAQETQRQLIEMADELAITNSELQKRVLYLIRQCAAKALRSHVA